ncbi:MAG: hypothetical protein IPO23_02300 [Flavobacterium sp.]|nr:hypothetical protein [Flavobacterium sp.]
MVFATLTGTAVGTYNSVNVATATTVTFTGVSLTGAQAGNYSLTAHPSQAATITKATAVITFGALAAKTTADVPFALTATSTSGNTVTYVSGTPATATISGSTVTIVAAGSTVITASDAGNANYDAAVDVPQTLTVTAGPNLE